MISRLKPSAGKLLICEPFLVDPNFARSVIFITEHSDTGTVGFVINRQNALDLEDLISDMEPSNFPVFSGGPVAMDTIHFIHRCPDKIADGEEIAKGIFWGGNFETLKALVAAGAVTPDEVKFFVGYSGWSEQQLQDEIESNTWMVSDQYDADMIFRRDEEALWKEVIIHLGPKYAHISKFPHNPNLN